MTIISWNINGLRAAERKGLLNFIAKGRYDLVCLQEVKADSENLLSENLKKPKNYLACFNLATERKGYSGVAVYSRKKPVRVKTDFGRGRLSTEGRILELEFEEFTLLNVYFPNGGGDDQRLVYKLDFFDEFKDYLEQLVASGKKVIFAGDLNIAHAPIDLARPKANETEIGFLPIERTKLDAFAAAGFVDTFRHLHPAKIQYSWWDLKSRARDRNVGWRLDYFWVSRNLLPKVKRSFILDKIDGSDHAPVGLTLDF